MKKELNIGKLIGLFRLLDNAKADKLEMKERYALAKLLLAIHKRLVDYEALEQETVKRLRPADRDETEALMAELRAMTDQQRAESAGEQKYAEAIRKDRDYIAAVDECLLAERLKLTEIEFEQLPEGWMERLIDSNPDWKVGQMAAVMELME